VETVAVSAECWSRLQRRLVNEIRCPADSSTIDQEKTLPYNPSYATASTQTTRSRMASRSCKNWKAAYFCTRGSVQRPECISAVLSAMPRSHSDARTAAFSLTERQSL